MNIKKVKLQWVILGIMIILIVFGIYKNPDRHTEEVYAEYLKISELNVEYQEELRTSFKDYESCFNPELKDQDIATFCIEGINQIQNLVLKDQIITSQGKDFIEKYKNKMTPEIESFISQQVKLVDSEEYNSYVKALNLYLDKELEWQIHVRDNISEPEDVTDSMILQSIVIGREIDRAKEKLDSTRIDLENYLKNNFEKEFIEKFGITT